jgi:hypothetical protein
MLRLLLLVRLAVRARLAAVDAPRWRAALVEGVDDVAAELPDVLDRLIVAGDVERLRHRRRLELVEETDPVDLTELLCTGNALVEAVPQP